MVACAKCGNLKHLITDQECDGVHIGEYPLLKREFEKAKNLFENFNFEGAGDRLKAICAVWPDFPGSAGLASDISSMKKKLLPSLDMISEYCAKKKYFSAAETIELVDAKRPGFKKNYGVVYSKINSAIEDLLITPCAENVIRSFMRYRTVKKYAILRGRSARISLLRRALSIIMRYMLILARLSLS